MISSRERINSGFDSFSITSVESELRSCKCESLIVVLITFIGPELYIYPLFLIGIPIIKGMSFQLEKMM